MLYSSAVKIQQRPRLVQCGNLTLVVHRRQDAVWGVSRREGGEAEGEGAGDPHWRAARPRGGRGPPQGEDILEAAGRRGSEMQGFTDMLVSRYVCVLFLT